MNRVYLRKRNQWFVLPQHSWKLFLSSSVPNHSESSHNRFRFSRRFLLFIFVLLLILYEKCMTNCILRAFTNANTLSCSSIILLYPIEFAIKMAWHVCLSMESTERENAPKSIDEQNKSEGFTKKRKVLWRTQNSVTQSNV